MCLVVSGTLAAINLYQFLSIIINIINFRPPDKKSSFFSSSTFIGDFKIRLLACLPINRFLASGFHDQFAFQSEEKKCWGVLILRYLCPNFLGFVCHQSFPQYLAFHLIEISIAAWGNFFVGDFGNLSEKYMIFLCYTSKTNNNICPHWSFAISGEHILVCRSASADVSGHQQNQKYHFSANIRPRPIYEPSGAVGGRWGYVRRVVIVVWLDSIPVNFWVLLKPKKICQWLSTKKESKLRSSQEVPPPLIWPLFRVPEGLGSRGVMYRVIQCPTKIIKAKKYYSVLRFWEVIPGVR